MIYNFKKLTELTKKILLLSLFYTSAMHNNTINSNRYYDPDVELPEIEVSEKSDKDSDEDKEFCAYELKNNTQLDNINNTQLTREVAQVAKNLETAQEEFDRIFKVLKQKVFNVAKSVEEQEEKLEMYKLDMEDSRKKEMTEFNEKQNRLKAKMSKTGIFYYDKYEKRLSNLEKSLEDQTKTVQKHKKTIENLENKNLDLQKQNLDLENKNLDLQKQQKNQKKIGFFSASVIALLLLLQFCNNRIIF